MDLIAASGGEWIFIGMESIDPANLASVNKGFNKPGEYAGGAGAAGATATSYAITSFIFGMDNDTPGVAERTLQQIRTWPPGLPVFGLLTPLPGNAALQEAARQQGRLTRPKHWLDFMPFAMAHTPLKMTVEEAHDEVRYGWDHAYSPEAIAHAVNSFGHKPVGYRINILIARLCFRGIYFPQMGPMAWVKVIAENRRTIFELVKEGFETDWGVTPKNSLHPGYCRITQQRINRNLRPRKVPLIPGPLQQVGEAANGNPRPLAEGGLTAADAGFQGVDNVGLLIVAVPSSPSADTGQRDGRRYDASELPSPCEHTPRRTQ